MFIERFYPTKYYASSYEIDYEGLYADGIRGLIYDLDNTLVPHDAPADERALKLLNSLKEMGFEIFFLSNNKEARVKMFNEKIGAKYIFKASKPSPKGYLEAAKMMGLKPKQVAVIGDQLFTDIWGANKAGMCSCLVVPIDRSTDKPQIVLKRYLENPILKKYLKTHEMAKKTQNNEK